MAIHYHEWKRRWNKTRPSLDERMEYVKYIYETNTALAPIVVKDWVNVFARDEQVPYYYSNDWDLFAYIGGRGIGKTKTGNEWLRHLCFDKHNYDSIYIGVICPVNNDIDSVMIYGDSGFFNILTEDQLSRCKYNSSKNIIIIDHGTDHEKRINFFSAENAERLRGKQWHYLWLDELAAFDKNKIEDILIQCDMCLRLVPPRQTHNQRLITTTPKPQPWVVKIFKDAEKDDRIILATGTTYDNRANLSESMFKSLIKYEGTALGRQEIHGEILLENLDGIIKKEWIRLWPANKPIPKLHMVFGSYDLAATEDKKNDPSARVIFGMFRDTDNDGNEDWAFIVLDNSNEWIDYTTQRVQMLNDWDFPFGDKNATPPNIKKPNVLIVENKSNGQAILRDINKLGVKMIKYTPGRGDDKYSRLHSVAHYILKGRLYFFESKKNPGSPHPYYKECYEQLYNFPMVTHDDYVDCISQAFIIFANKQLLLSDMTDRDYYDEDGEDHNIQIPFIKKENPYMRVS